MADRPALERRTKETPLGPLPDAWGVVRLKTVSVESTKRNKDLTYERSDVLGVDNKTGLIPSDRKLGDDFSRYKLVGKNHFAYNPMRLNVRSIGLWRQNRTQVVSPDYIVFGCDEEQLDADFLDLFIDSAAWERQIQQSGQGSIRIRYYYRHIGEFFIPLPLLAEQRAIARALRAVQETRETRQRELALERERKAALMQHLFTFGMTSANIETQQTLFGLVPKKWSVAPLSECAKVQSGVAVGRQLGKGPTVTLSYLRVANVQNGFLDLSEIKEITIRAGEVERFRLKPLDVVLTEGGDFDKLGRGFIWAGQILNCVHQNHIFAVRANEHILSPYFFAYLTQSDYGRNYFLTVAHKTTNLACINSSKLKAFPVLLPPLDEQRRIADVLTKCDAKIAAIQREANLLDELFRALLEELMSGRLSVAALVEGGAGP